MEWSENLMGQWVMVTKRLYRKEVNIGSGRYKIEWDCPIKWPPQKGMITGRRWLKNGILLPGSGSYDDYSPGYLTEIESIPCITVVFDSRHNPIYVPFGGFELFDNLPANKV